eukprot:2058950-Amphidinium_carterae.1
MLKPVAVLHMAFQQSQLHPQTEESRLGLEWSCKVSLGALLGDWSPTCMKPAIRAVKQSIECSE